MVICVYWFYPETSGLSLEAVDVIFTEDYTSWRGAVKKSLELRKEAKRTGNKRNDLEHMRLSHAGRDGELVEKDLDRDMLEHLENAAN